MEFPSGLSIDVKDWKAVEMRREINPYTYRPATNVDTNSASSSTIVTSLGTVIPKTGAGSEYGREQKEALKRKRYATKGTNIEDLPWIFTDRSSSEKKLKHYRGLKKGGVTTNSSYYVFIQGKDGFEAYPVEDWYGFSPTNVYKTLDFDEAEKQFQERHKNLSKWFLKHQVAKEKGDNDEPEIESGEKKGKPSTSKSKRDLKLLDAEDWINEQIEEDEEDDDEEDDDGDKDDKSTNKKSKTNKKNGKQPKGSWTLSDDDDEDEAAQAKAKKQKTTKRQTSEDQQGEDSDDGDHEGNQSKLRFLISTFCFSL
jgi:transcription initiation factor TFIIF subunit alpha